MYEIFEDFKNRKIKAKSIFSIKQISKNEAYLFIKSHHYLGDAKFFSMYAYGMFFNSKLVGVATFSNPQGTMSMKSWFNLENSDQSVVELSRLCVLPTLNGSNATSFLLGNSIKLLKQHNVRAVITLADSYRHVGSIYQVCNFEYFGLTNKKSDFYSYSDGGTVNPRGAVKNKRGVWLDRTRKHRYAYILDKTLACNYPPLPHPIKGDTYTVTCCSNGVVYDARFDEHYTCPKCSKFESLDFLN